METDIMVVAPHPDDAEIGMGGVLAVFSAAGFNTTVVDLSDGEPTPCGSRQVRLQERDQATKILGIHQRILLDFENRKIFDSVQNREKLAATIRQCRPKLLFAPYWEDAHPDHVQASALTDGARFYAKLVESDIPGDPFLVRRTFYYFCVHLKLKLQPSFVFDISAMWERKIEALRAYRSQFLENTRNQAVLERIRMDNAYWGQQVGVLYGEPFLCREYVRILTPESLLNA